MNPESREDHLAIAAAKQIMIVFENFKIPPDEQNAL